jgi:phosphatidylglycerophosphatase A
LAAQIRKLITTFFYLGYLPFIPGTFGSIAGLFIYIFLRENIYLLVLANVLIMVLGFLCAGKTAKAFNRRDPPQIVIDEMNGMLISFLVLPTQGGGEYFGNLGIILGFIIFRIFDSLKPYPANRLHRWGGSLGIMGDDIIAGIYTNLILRLFLIFSSHILL